MIFYLILFNVLFLPTIYSSDSTVTVNKSRIANKTQSVPLRSLSNETKVTVLSEGGSLMPETSILALPKEKLTNLDKELGKNKVKPVVARKGVVYIDDDNLKSLQQKLPIENGNPAIAHKIPHKTNVINDHSTNSTKNINSKANSTLLSKLSVGQNGVNVTETPKKPLILSYTSLANMTVKSSLAITSERPNKLYTKSSNSHPGMIMPLVITILLVPMFAVLGYMALRKGHEAWKNRHYKRMDFLLDGMYND